MMVAESQQRQERKKKLWGITDCSRLFLVSLVVMVQLNWAERKENSIKKKGRVII
jgi:hypothetical protein